MAMMAMMFCGVGVLAQSLGAAAAGPSMSVGSKRDADVLQMSEGDISDGSATEPISETQLPVSLWREPPGLELLTQRAAIDNHSSK